MQILVVDDYSTADDPAKVVQAIGGDRIEFYRQPKNVGKALNYQTGLNASRGRFIHQLHGDDYVGPDFYKSMEAQLVKFPEIAALYCESYYVDENNMVTGRTGKPRETSGAIEDFYGKVYVQQQIQTPSIVVRREVYEQLGGFDTRLSAFEDWEMWVRAARYFTFGFNAECHASYRVYQNNTSHQSLLNGQRARIQRLVLDIIDSRCSASIKEQFSASRDFKIAEAMTLWLPIAVRHGRLRVWLSLLSSLAGYSLHWRIWCRALRNSIYFKRFVA